jgi:hypothetical protein
LTVALFPAPIETVRVASATRLVAASFALRRLRLVVIVAVPLTLTVTARSQVAVTNSPAAFPRCVNLHTGGTGGAAPGGAATAVGGEGKLPDSVHGPAMLPHGRALVVRVRTLIFHRLAAASVSRRRASPPSAP